VPVNDRLRWGGMRADRGQTAPLGYQ
jgi:hypothetical protein